jgi:hypothetical protein
MSNAKKLQNVLQTRQSVDILPLEKILGLVCEEDAGKIRMAAKTHFPLGPRDLCTGYFTLVPWESFCCVAPKRDELTEETNALFGQLAENNGWSFYVQIDCP